ncbi:MAG: pitrilysin family protein [Vulcanimicrobiaceae bacterium]
MLTSPLFLPTESYLDNGLKVVLCPIAAAPVVTVMVLYRVGARNEAVGYTGSSHLLEHMLFKGTPANNRRNGRAFADIMNEIGASKNATTWIDRTNYFETVPSGYLDFALELEADRMRGAFIADDDRRSEMTVVRNELERNDNNVARVLSAAVVATAFREHPYHHPTIGWRTDVEGVSTQRLRELYDTFYHPDNATLFVVGDYDEAWARASIERHFGALPRAATTIPDVYTEEPAQAGERTVVVKRPGDSAIVSYAYHTPAALGERCVLSARALAERAAAMPADNDGFALEVLSRILGRGRTSRLSRTLVDTGLALDASAWNWGSRDPGLFQITINVRPGVAADDVRRELDRVIASVVDDVASANEIERAQTQLEVQRAFARDGTFALAGRLAEFEAVGTWRLVDAYVDGVRGVTAERVREAARAYLHDDNRTVGTLVPGTARTFDNVAFEPVAAAVAHAPTVENAPLPPPRPQATTPFASRIARGRSGAGVTWQLVVNTDTPTVHVRGSIDAGPAYAAGRPLVPQIVAELLSRGTRSQPRQAIEERLERAGIRRGYAIDDDSSSGYNARAFRFAGACARADLATLLETIAQELREPAFHDAELALVKGELAGSLRLARNATGWRAYQRFSELAYVDGDVNAIPGVDALLADLEAIELDDVRAYHRDVVLRGGILVTATGATDERDFATLVARTIGRVPFAGETVATSPIVRARPPRAIVERVELERKSNVDIVLGRATSLVRAAADFDAASVANGILGQSTLSSRLGLRLRDREGLTYGVTSGFVAGGALPGAWRIGVGVNPANVDRAIHSVREVLREYAATGPTPRELVAQANSMAGQHHVSLATNAGIAAQLERLTYYNLGDDYVDTYRDRVLAVTREDVSRAIAAYLDERDLIVVAAGTFA